MCWGKNPDQETMNLRLIHQSRPLSAAAATAVSSQQSHRLQDLTKTKIPKPEPTYLNQYKADQLLNLRQQEILANNFFEESSVSIEEDVVMIEERMGSFTSSPAKLTKSDDQDEDLDFSTSNREELLDRCQDELDELPPALERGFSNVLPQHTSNDSSSQSSGIKLRVFQWNILSQTLGTKKDNFINCPAEALNWTTRRWRILEEIIQHDPDIICLQEVDHFKLIKKALCSIGYHGRFVPKPDSPCIHLEDNNGPDGCAIFYKKQKLELVNKASKTLEIWGVKSNQVILGLNLLVKESGKEICVATTHLKARNGTLLSNLRNEQGKDILAWLEKVREDRPVILTGDFNADPTEPIYKTMTDHENIPLESAYTISSDRNSNANNEMLGYTSWKIRETGEEMQILDYIFHSPELTAVATLNMPTEEEVGKERLPSLAFASDHLSLVADIEV